MITSTIINNLDRRNLSKNADLTALRFSEDLTNATAEQKKQISDLSGRSRATLYKVKSNGIISARLLAAISFVLNISPYWYTGEAEAKEKYSDELMQKFLNENNYESALQIAQGITPKNEKKPKRKYTRRDKQETPPKKDRQNITNKQQPEADMEKPPNAANDWHNSDTVKHLGLEDGCKLLEALYIRAKANPVAAEQLQKVFEILFS